MAITIIFGKPRVGKTALMTHFLTQEMFNRERYRNMEKEIKRKTDNVFKLSVPSHCVCSNYDIIGRKFGYRPRISRRINPFRLGYSNDKVKTHFIEPFTVIGITEGQKYFNSRVSQYYPDWQSRWFEQHGHNNYDIYIDVQRPKLIDLNIRELSQFIEIVKKENRTDASGRITAVKWTVRHFAGSSELDQYLSSGKRDVTTYTQETIVAGYNVHDCYNSQMCKPKFYDSHAGISTNWRFDGHMDFDTKQAELLQESLEGYVKYLKELDDELPENFYAKR